MDTIWAFGDSYTQSYQSPRKSRNNWRNEYVDWKGYNIKVYPELLAEKLEYDLVNKGMDGCDNSYIFEEFCKVASQIKQNDIVIFGWTDVHRFRLFNKKNEVGFFNTNALSKDGPPAFSKEFFKTFDSLSMRTIEETLLNRDSIMFIEELCNWIHLINLFLKDITVIHWSWSSRNDTCGNIIIPPSYERIYNETHGVVNNYHWSELGNKMFSEFLIKKINKNNLI